MKQKSWFYLFCKSVKIRFFFSKQKMKNTSLRSSSLWNSSPLPPLNDCQPPRRTYLKYPFQLLDWTLDNFILIIFTTMLQLNFVISIKTGRYGDSERWLLTLEPKVLALDHNPVVSQPQMQEFTLWSFGILPTETICFRMAGWCSGKTMPSAFFSTSGGTIQYEPGTSLFIQ